MRMTRRENLFLLGSAAALPMLGAAGSARAAAETEAKVVEVQMLNAHPENPREKMVFYPDIVQVNPGDTIRFLPSDRGHNVAADEEMLPKGAEAWKSQMEARDEVARVDRGEKVAQRIDARGPRD